MARKKTTPPQRPRDPKTGRFIPSVNKPAEKVKNTKRVEAGKKRQATGIKDDKGRFISKLYSNVIKKTLLATKKVDTSKINDDQSDKIDELLKDNNIKAEQVKKFYEKNREFIDEMASGEIQATSKNSNQIENAIDEYKGDFFIKDEKGNVKQVNKSQAKFEILNFKNSLSDTLNVVDFRIKPVLTLDGKMTLNLPNVSNLYADLRQRLGMSKNESFDEFTGGEIMEALADIIESYGLTELITIYAS